MELRAPSSLVNSLFTAVKPAIAVWSSRAVLVDTIAASCACRRISSASAVASVKICGPCLCCRQDFVDLKLQVGQCIFREALSLDKETSDFELDFRPSRRC